MSLKVQRMKFEKLIQIWQRELQFPKAYKDVLTVRYMREKQATFKISLKKFFKELILSRDFLKKLTYFQYFYCFKVQCTSYYFDSTIPSIDGKIFLISNKIPKYHRTVIILTVIIRITLQISLCCHIVATIYKV